MRGQDVAAGGLYRAPQAVLLSVNRTWWNVAACPQVDHLWLRHDVQEVEDAVLPLLLPLPLAEHGDGPVHCRLRVIAVVDWNEVMLAASPCRTVHRQQRAVDLFWVRRLQGGAVVSSE